MKIKIFIMALIAVLGPGSVLFAQQTSGVAVDAIIPSMSQLDITISKVVGTTWTTETAVDFGELSYDPLNHIFKTQDGHYYAVDVSILNNGPVDWTVTHNGTPVQRDATNNLNDNINVTFSRAVGANAGEAVLSKVSYANSNNTTILRSQLVGGWLRIYYGLGTGLNDAVGVLPITIDKPSGNYRGTVTLTLAP